MFNKNNKKIIVTSFIIIFTIIILRILYYSNNNVDSIKVENNESQDIEQNENLETAEIYVHITGNVENPGMLILENGSRLNDAVDLCGGFLEGTDMENINLALKLKDEDKIHIPKIGEVTTTFKEDQDDRVEINRCTKAELLSLPGIGEKKAEQIIEYRERNKFEKIEDIMEVSGIGEKTFENFKDYIFVE